MEKHEIYSEKKVRNLKRCLLGFCGKSARKSSDDLVKAIQKAEIAYSPSSVEKVVRNLLELSRSNKLVYDTTTDTFFSEPNIIVDDLLHISKRDENSYDVAVLQHERSPPLDYNLLF